MQPLDKPAQDRSAAANRGVYEWRRAARVYDRSELFPPESRIFERVGAECQGKAILDLGVGAGRTTAALLKISRNYTGIDYSAGMVKRFRERFPGVGYRLLDVRQLAGLEGNHYAFVLFSFNGLDYISHEERQGVLAEIARVTAPGGWFAFSSHNRRFQVPLPWSAQNMRWSWNPWRAARQWARYANGILQYTRRAHLREEHQRYAYRIDGGLNFRLLTYYAEPDEVVRQLARVGMQLEWQLDDAGNLVLDSNSTAPWLYYLARKVNIAR